MALGLISKYNSFRCAAKGREGGNRILEIEYLGIVVILVIHTAQIRIGIQHGLFGLDPTVLSQLTCYTNPSTLMEGRQLHLGIGNDLAGAGLYLTGLQRRRPCERIFRPDGSRKQKLC